MCEEAACLQEIQIQHLAELIRHLIAALPGEQFGTVLVERLEILENQALSISHGNYSAIAQISDSVRQDLIQKNTVTWDVDVVLQFLKKWNQQNFCPFSN